MTSPDCVRLTVSDSFRHAADVLTNSANFVALVKADLDYAKWAVGAAVEMLNKRVAGGKTSPSSGALQWLDDGGEGPSRPVTKVASAAVEKLHQAFRTEAGLLIRHPDLRKAWREHRQIKNGHVFDYIQEAGSRLNNKINQIAETEGQRASKAASGAGLKSGAPDQSPIYGGGSYNL